MMKQATFTIIMITMREATIKAAIPPAGKAIISETNILGLNHDRQHSRRGLYKCDCQCYVLARYRTLIKIASHPFNILRIYEITSAFFIIRQVSEPYFISFRMCVEKCNPIEHI